MMRDNDRILRLVATLLDVWCAVINSVDDDTTRFGDLEEFVERIMSLRLSGENTIGAQVIIWEP